MKWWPFNKKLERTTIDDIVGILSVIKLHHVVTHEFMPKPTQPPPTSITFRLRNNRGEEWVLEPMMIYGQSTSRVRIPVAFITNDHSAPDVILEARLHYS